MKKFLFKNYKRIITALMLAVMLPFLTTKTGLPKANAATFGEEWINQFDVNNVASVSYRELGLDGALINLTNYKESVLVNDFIDGAVVVSSENISLNLTGFEPSEGEQTIATNGVINFSSTTQSYILFGLVVGGNSQTVFFVFNGTGSVNISNIAKNLFGDFTGNLLLDDSGIIDYLPEFDGEIYNLNPVEFVFGEIELERYNTPGFLLSYYISEEQVYADCVTDKISFFAKTSEFYNFAMSAPYETNSTYTSINDLNRTFRSNLSVDLIKSVQEGQRITLPNNYLLVKLNKMASNQQLNINLTNNPLFVNNLNINGLVSQLVVISEQPYVALEPYEGVASQTFVPALVYIEDDGINFFFGDQEIEIEGEENPVLRQLVEYVIPIGYTAPTTSERVDWLSYVGIIGGAVLFLTGVIFGLPVLATIGAIMVVVGVVNAVTNNAIGEFLEDVVGGIGDFVEGVIEIGDGIIKEVERVVNTSPDWIKILLSILLVAGLIFIILKRRI